MALGVHREKGGGEAGRIPCNKSANYKSANDKSESYMRKNDTNNNVTNSNDKSANANALWNLCSG